MDKSKISLIVLFVVMVAGLIFLGIKAYGPDDCQQSYNDGLSSGLTQLIQQVETNKVAIIGMPNNQSYAVTNPKYCQALIQAAQQ